MRAARIMGVAPWDLAKQPTYWRERAMLMDAAEREATDAMQPKRRGET